MSIIKQEIERLVNKFSWSGDSKNLIRIELEYLVAIAEREQMIKDHDLVMKELKSK